MATNTGTNGTYKAPKTVCGIVITEADEAAAKKVDIETVMAEADAFEAEMVAAEKAEKAAYAAAH